MYKLVIEDDEGKTTVVPLIRDEITIGRKEGNTIRLTERNVSRRHARLVKSSAAIAIEDLGSYNGVKINGGKIQARTPIREGDRILIGDYQLWIQLDRAASAGPAAAQKDGIDQAPTTAMPRLAPAATAAMPAAQKGAAAAPATGGAKHARLVILNSNLAGLDFPVEKAECVLGRTEDNDIVINHRSISRNHAKVVLEAGTYKIVDLGSANGVRVNGEDYGKVELRKGDIIELGHVKIRFVPPGEPFVFDPRVDKLADAPAGRPPIAIIAVAAVAVIGVAVGAYLIFKGPGDSGGDDRTAKTAPKDTKGGGGGGGSSADDGASELTEVKDAIKAREWESAIAALDKSGASGAEADGLRKTATFEKEQKDHYERFSRFVEENNDFEAFGEASAMDKKSVYWTETEAKYGAIKSRLVTEALRKAKEAITSGDFPLARKSIDEAKTYDPYDGEIPKVEATLRDAEKVAAKTVAVADPDPKGVPDKPKVDPKPKKDPTVTPKTAAPAATAAPAEDDTAGGREKAKEEYTKGLRLFAASHEPEAMAAFKKAIKIDPKFPDPHRALGTIYARSGNLKLMCKEFKTYVKLNPHAGDTAKIKAEMGKYDATVPECRSGD